MRTIEASRARLGPNTTPNLRTKTRGKYDGSWQVQIPMPEGRPR